MLKITFLPTGTGSNVDTDKISLFLIKNETGYNLNITKNN